MQYSPWGKIQNKTKLFKGVYWVETPGHGGLKISRSYAINTIDYNVVSLMGIYYGGYYWFEEDCAIFGPILSNEKIREAYANKIGINEITLRIQAKKSLELYFPSILKNYFEHFPNF